ncbi:hypothetical protein HYQ43_07700 [Paracoccus pantotrophus]|uniref:Uncharacterized protein n=2 Tax=Paracoccus TaxID=265 RepID=A0A7H9BRY2_PARPN|nr:hypothetical protein [Paracoccus pantotrophus]QLH14120.1 hypothetical protein HYQ43_07700 [Paracoccus pantotrophus]
MTRSAMLTKYHCAETADSEAFEYDYGSPGGELVIYVLAATIGGLIGVSLALFLGLPLLGVFLAYSLGGIGLVIVAAAGLFLARSVRKSMTLAIRQNRSGYSQQD